MVEGGAGEEVDKASGLQFARTSPEKRAVCGLRLQLQIRGGCGFVLKDVLISLAYWVHGVQQLLWDSVDYRSSGLPSFCCSSCSPPCGL